MSKFQAQRVPCLALIISVMLCVACLSSCVCCGLLRRQGQAGLTRETLAQGITWSAATVLAETAAQLRGCGLSVAPLDTLPKLLDIDTAEVWPGHQSTLRCWHTGIGNRIAC